MPGTALAGPQPASGAITGDAGGIRKFQWIGCINGIRAGSALVSDRRINLPVLRGPGRKVHRPARGSGRRDLG